MKNNRLFGLTLLILLGVGMVFSAVYTQVVQARDLNPEEWDEANIPPTGAKPTQAVYNPAAYSEVWGIAPDMLVNCDPNGTLLASTNPGSAQTYRKLQTAACRQQAALDEQVAMAAQGGCSGAGWSGNKSCGYSGVSGDGNQLKIYGFTSEVRYVYLQCGKKVGVVGPPTCSCSSGAYQYSCKRPPTGYISIPCH